MADYNPIPLTHTGSFQDLYEEVYENQDTPGYTLNNVAEKYNYNINNLVDVFREVQKKEQDWYTSKDEWGLSWRSPIRPPWLYNQEVPLSRKIIDFAFDIPTIAGRKIIKGGKDLGAMLLEMGYPKTRVWNPDTKQMERTGDPEISYEDLSKIYTTNKNNLTNYLRENKYTSPIVHSSAFAYLTGDQPRSRAAEAVAPIAAYLPVMGGLSKTLNFIPKKGVLGGAKNATTFVGADLIVSDKEHTFLGSAGNYLKDFFEDYPELVPIFEALSIDENDTNAQKLLKKVVDGYIFYPVAAGALGVAKIGLTGHAKTLGGMLMWGGKKTGVTEAIQRALGIYKKEVNKDKAIKNKILEPGKIAENSNVSNMEIVKNKEGEYVWKITVSDPILSLKSDPKIAGKPNWLARFFSTAQGFDKKTFRAFERLENAPKSTTIALKEQNASFEKAIEDVYGVPYNKLDDKTLHIINLALGRKPVIGSNAPKEILKVLNKSPNKRTKDDITLLDKYYTELVTTAQVEKQAALEMLHPRIQKEINHMRIAVDTYTNRIKQTMGLSKNMNLILDKNMGLYLSDDYKMFVDPKWGKDIIKILTGKGATEGEAFNAVVQAKKLIKKAIPNADDKAINDYLLTYVDKNIKDKDGILSMLDLGSNKYISEHPFGKILTKRKVIDEPLKILLGPVTNPQQRWNNTIRKMSAIVAEHDFLTTIKEIANSKYGLNLFKTETGGLVEGQRLTAELDTLASNYIQKLGPNANPVAGIFTSKTYKDWLDKGIELAAPSNNAWATAWYTLSGYSSMAKTSLSHNTHLRNFQGNFAFLGVNGNLGPRLFSDIPKTVKDLARVTPENINIIRKLTENGVLNSGVRAQQVIRTLDDAINNTEGWFANINKPAKFMGKAYGVEDDIFKLISYYAELAKYTKAFPKWTPAEVEQYTMEIVKRTMPTYHKLIRPVKQLRRLPIGTFPAFTHEVFRATKDTVSIAMRDIYQGINTGNSVLRNIGIKRLLSTIATGYGMKEYVEYNKAKYDITKNDEKAMDFLGQDWHKNQIRDYTTPIFLNPKTGRIETTYRNLTYSLPHAPIIQIVENVIPYLFSEGAKLDLENNNTDNLDDVIQSVAEAFEPFYNESLLFGPLANVVFRGGKPRKGKNIYGLADTPIQRGTAALGHIWKQALQPGSLTTFENLYDSFMNERINNQITEGYGVSTSGYPKRLTDQLKSISGIKHETFDLSKAFQTKSGLLIGNVNRANSNIITSLNKAYNIDWNNQEHINEYVNDFKQNVQFAFKQQQNVAELFHNFKKLKYYEIIDLPKSEPIIAAVHPDHNLIAELLTNAGTKEERKNIYYTELVNDVNNNIGVFISPSIKEQIDNLQKDLKLGPAENRILIETLKGLESILVNAEGTPLLTILEEEE